MSEKKLLWTAIAAGILAVVCVELYVGSRLGKPVRVLFAKKDLPEGHVFQTGDVEPREMTIVPQGAMTVSNAALLQPSGGVRTRSAVRANTPLFFADLAAPADARLSDRIPADRRALSIPVTKASSVTHMILPDDEVEILVTGPAPPGGEPPIERVPGTYRILAVGSRLGTSALDGPSSYDTVTVVVTPAEAERLVKALARQRGGAATLLLCGRQR